MYEIHTFKLRRKELIKQETIGGPSSCSNTAFHTRYVMYNVKEGRGMIYDILCKHNYCYVRL